MWGIIQLIQILLVGIIYGVYSYQSVSESKFSNFLKKHGTKIIFISIILIFILSFVGLVI